MEKNTLAAEDSVDSIPGPAYEHIIVNASTLAPTLKSDLISTNILAVTEDEDADMEDDECSGGNDEHMDVEDDQDEVDDELEEPETEVGSFVDDEFNERDDYKENDSHLKLTNLNALEHDTVVTVPHTEQISEIDNSSTTTVTTTLVNSAPKMNSQTEAIVESSLDGVAICPVPVQIVSAVTVKPKMLPMKTKNNKLIMVQMMNEQPVDRAKLGVHSSSSSQASNGSGRTIDEVVESVVSDVGKLNSPNQEKSPDSSQLNQQQQNVRFLARSSTPLSREFLALQRSVNESKVLSEFVTDAVRKRQKSAPKDANEQIYTQQQQQHHHHHHHYYGEKHRKPSKFAPLKDDSGSSTSSTLQRRSRSKSVNRKSEDILDSSIGKLKRWPSDEKLLKRTNMRSQNSEFVQKQMEFLNRVKHDEGEVSSEADDGERSFANVGEDDDMNLVLVENNAINDSNASAAGLVSSINSLLDTTLERETSTNIVTTSNVDSVEARLKKYWAPPPKRGWDSFCWKCRQSVDLFPCSKCVRCYHCTCIKVTAATKLDDSWVCPECMTVENVLNGPKRSSRRNEMSLDVLSQLLSFALKRMKMVKGYSKFLYTDSDLLHYSKYIANPVTFTTLQEKIEKRTFRCCEEFLNETKWILHNALILNSGSSSKEVFTAKAILKVCRQETNEIDTCGECYLNANTRTDWFVDVCAQPHLLLWAKLKGFPYWPAKAMGPGQGLSHVNVRFFGEHDRAFVPIKDCFLYSEQDPNTQTGKRSARELADCIKEVEVHIENIRAKVGAFKYAKFKTPYEPTEELQQLEMMIPGVMDYMKRQQALVPKPSLQYKIVKTADNHLSIIKKACTTESSNDSDHSASPNKKPSSVTCTSSSCGVGEVKGAIVTPKYEVVSKASSDDSNSSKVTAVILKRKSSSEHKKEAGDGVELPMPKVIKFDKEDVDQRLVGGVNLTAKPDVNAETSTYNASSKRKYGTDTSGSSVDSATNVTETADRPRTKHAKHEPRVPVITIKTNANALTVAMGTESKIASSSAVPNSNSATTTTKVNAEARTTAAVNEVKEELAVVATLVPLTTPSNKAQALMENLVKNKHGVTIKKISKEGQTRKADESAKLAAGMNTVIEETQTNTDCDAKKPVAATDTASGTQTSGSTNNTDNDNGNANVKKCPESSSSNANKTDDSKKSSTKSTTNTHILKDLVPFVEIKKEITSDDEADMQIAANINGAQINKHVNETAPNVTPVIVPTPKVNVDTTSHVSLPVVVVPAVLPNLSLIKQEIMSDEEETTTATANTVTTFSATQQDLNTTSTGGDNASNIPAVGLPDAVRVGDTMIQRLNAKNNRGAQPGLVSLKTVAATTPEGAAVMDMPSVQNSAAMHISPANRRSNTRGVPYGPLPASAVPQSQSQIQKSTTQANRATMQQQQQLSQSSPASQVQTQSQSLQPLQRARKSFPNRVTPDNGATRSNNFSCVPLSSPVLPPPSTSPLSNNNDLKRTLLKNSMVSIPRQAWSPHESQRNVIVNNNNTNTHSIPVPPLTAVSKTPTVVAVLGDNNNADSTNNNNMLINTNPATNVAINSAAIVTPFVTCNGGIGPNGPALLTPLTMSAPPPLAGLSQPSSNMLTPMVGASMCTNMPMSGNNNNINVSSGSGIMSISSAVELPTQQTVGISSSAINAASTSSVDVVTSSLTSMVTDAICRGPPRLMQRPNGPLKSDGTTMFPSQAGPVCQTLVENAHKLTDFFISVMEDTMLEMSEGDEPVLQAKITILKIELERTKQAYEQEIAELKRTSDLMLSEMRKSMENEKTRISNEIRKQCEQERLRSIEETKKKQWCSNCGREAQFYCCWNTSYCDYPCQQMHWSRHSATCAQTRPTIASASDSMAKTVSTMTTTVSAMGLQQQPQQQHVGCGNKNSNNNMTAVTTATSIAASQHQPSTLYNKNNNKKDKHSTSKVSHQQSATNSSSVGSSSNNTMNSITPVNAAGVAVAQGAATEVLKLPSNTYLRTVPQCGNPGNGNSGGGNLRSSTYSVQRVNIPLPITALVQRGNSWELTSAAPNNNVGAANMATITAPGSNVTQAMTQLTTQQQPQQHQRMLSGGGTGNVSGGGGSASSNISSSRSNSRSRAAAAVQALQQTMATIHGPTGGAATSMSCGMLRPTQM
uniref:Protein kinase C-binding protein 1 n=1 Tax=Zeugodacus cucurbitae TaxID=28588 RepID=A0A0A1WZE1_ZEUCU